jgi:DNA mismatch repair protein MutS
MGGKSTYLRQNAIILILAFIGSYVPADNVNTQIIDEIFTRVGASDNLGKGESTFMVEMSETANILKNATKNSFIILDEVGRGTSTYDGMSIAWAICEHIAKIKAKTLFATHYHELVELSNKFDNIANLTLKVVEYNEEIIFMHQIISGSADKSHGIHVAKLAGMPENVLKTAKKILTILEKEKNALQHKPFDIFSENPEQKQENIKNKYEEAIKKIDINKLTPIEAFEIIKKLKEN